MVERDYRSHALAGSLLFHGGLLAIFLFFYLTTPDPPFTETGGSGVVLNYGTVEEGTGDLQTHNQANPSPVNEEAAPPAAQEKVEEEQKAAEKVPEVKEDDQKMLTSDDEESVKIKEEKKVETKTKTAPVKETIEEKKTTVAKVENKEKASSNGTTGTEAKTGGNNNGDKENKVGDQGNPKGNIDSRIYSGNLGENGPGPGGTGTSLAINGWNWVDEPKVSDESSETGTIVIEFTIDGQGTVISANAVNSAFSPAVRKKYEEAVRKIEFEKTRDNVSTAARTIGRITFRVRSR